MFRFLISTALTASAVLGASWIVPGAVWHDTSGNVIDAHGGGIYQRGSTFYWIGHSAPDTSSVTPKLYSSTDLLSWDFLGTIAPTAQSIWRPKLAKPNGDFWIYGQQDRYVLSLKSSALTSGYSQVAKVHLPPDSYTYSDTGMFLDPVSSTYYILTSADHNTIQINKINSDGSVGAQASRLSKCHRASAGALEAPGMLYDNGVYFLIASNKTGYRPNPNKVYTATSLSGPWSGGSDIAPPAQNTYNSQNTFELTIKGSQATTHIYMGDDWTSSGGSGSTYVWLPLKVDASTKTAKLDYHSMWKVDVNTGVVSYPTTKKRYAPDQNSLSKRSGVKETTFRNIAGTGALQWVKLHYTVNDPRAGEAYIIVNNHPALNVSDLNSRAGHSAVVPVQLKLEAGEGNTITLGRHGKGLEIDVAGLEILDD